MHELVFNTVTLDEAMFFLAPLSFFYAGLFLVAISRGRIRRWLRPSSQGGSLRLTVKHPFEDDYGHPSRLIRWWARLLIPVLLALPVGVGVSLFLSGPRATVPDLLMPGGISGLVVGLVLMFRQWEGGPRES